MQTIDINILELLGKDCITIGDANILAHTIETALNNSMKVNVLFKGIEDVSTTFLNVAFLSFLINKYELFDFINIDLSGIDNIDISGKIHDFIHEYRIMGKTYRGLITGRLSKEFLYYYGYID